MAIDSWFREFIDVGIADSKNRFTKEVLKSGLAEFSAVNEFCIIDYLLY